MAARDHAILDLGEDDLQFTTNDYKSSSDNRDEMTRFPDPDQPNRDTERLVDDSQSSGSKWMSSAFWTMSFYQQFFDIEDKDVRTRLLYSMVPIPGKSFLQHHIRPKPDLYGPFWTCVTLIFSIAISGNLADYLSSSLVGQAKWHYDFHKVTLASTAVFSYAGIIPACLYGYLWWMGQGGGALAVSFLELLCLYGYSITIYIPISVLWLICVKVGWLQWVLVLVGASLSGAVLFSTIWPAVRENAAKTAWIVMVVILGLHLLLACGFMLYFFHASGAETAEIVPVGPGDNTEAPPATAALLKQAEEDVEHVTRAIQTFNPGNDPNGPKAASGDKPAKAPEAANLVEAGTNAVAPVKVSEASGDSKKSPVQDDQDDDNAAGDKSEDRGGNPGKPAVAAVESAEKAVEPVVKAVEKAADAVVAVKDDAPVVPAPAVPAPAVPDPAAEPKEAESKDAKQKDGPTADVQQSLDDPGSSTKQ